MFRPAIAVLVCLTVGALPGAAAEIRPGASLSHSTCLSCHAGSTTGFSAAHAFAKDNCVVCHSGDNTGGSETEAHAGLIAFPGALDNAGRSCAGCHADKVTSVTQSLMHSGHGIVDVTRRLIDGHAGPVETINLQSLGHGVADSLLRKQCASCHLGQPKTKHSLNAMSDRGGGCLACHVNDYPETGHAALTTSVSDARCFGCHSRSGRVSLSYTGLAEVASAETGAEAPALRLSDGRPVERMPADVHYAAGMACIDCHTGSGLMGGIPGARHQRDAVDIGCNDCHDLVNRSGVAARTTRGTPLRHIEVRGGEAWLHTKITKRKIRIPSLDPAWHQDDSEHTRLECATCHSQWVPQCFGCHIEYDADGRQWDHVERKQTPGRWTEVRSDFRNELGTLGVNEHDRVELFVPGMIMTIAHPDWDSEKLVRAFAPLSPHTTGAARSCESCHRSSTALGLGQGEIIEQDGGYRFDARHEPLRDGLAADAWTTIDGGLRGVTPLDGQRPLSSKEIQAMLNAALPRRQQPSSAGGGGSSSTSSDTSNTGGTKGSSLASPSSDAAPERSPTK